MYGRFLFPLPMFNGWIVDFVKRCSRGHTPGRVAAERRKIARRRSRWRDRSKRNTCSWGQHATLALHLPSATARRISHCPPASSLTRVWSRFGAAYPNKGFCSEGKPSVPGPSPVGPIDGHTGNNDSPKSELSAYSNPIRPKVI